MSFAELDGPKGSLFRLRRRNKRDSGLFSGCAGGSCLSFESIFRALDGKSCCDTGMRHVVDTKVWAIPSSNCAAYFVQAEW